MASPALFPGRVKPQAIGLLSAALPSPMGDAVGLLADAAGYAEDPGSLTLGSGLLSLAAMAPGVPRSGAANDVKKAVAKLTDWTRGEGSKDFLLHIADSSAADSIAKKGLLPAKSDGYVYLWDGGLDADSARIMAEARQTRNPALDWDAANTAPNAYIAVDRKAIGNRIELDPHTGEARVKGRIPPGALRILERE